MSIGAYKLREFLAEELDLPKDVVVGLPKISITGDEEITIENHNGITYFGTSQIIIMSNIGKIVISGTNFEIRYIGGSTIAITGRFKKVFLEEDIWIEK